MSFKVCKKRCTECLFSDDKLVSEVRKDNIIAECMRKDVTFLCHKGTMNDQEITCRGFYDQFPGVGNMRRIAERLGAVEFVEIPNQEVKLTSYRKQGEKDET